MELAVCIVVGLVAALAIVILVMLYQSDSDLS